MISKLLTSLLLYAAEANAFANPMPCFGICNTAQDPSLIQRSNDSTYYRFSTGGNISIYTAPSAQGPWAFQGPVLPSGSSIDLAGNNVLWAPDVHEINNTYYLYYAISTAGSQNSAIGVATSSKLDSGSWMDHGSTGIESITNDSYNAIDPNLIEVNGSLLMNFGSFFTDIYQIKMPTALESLSSLLSDQLAFNATGNHSIEGAFMYNTNSYYYLFFSSGVCCGFNVTKPTPGDEYKIMVCRSSNPSGGFVDKNGVKCTESGGTLVLGSHNNVYAPGGQGVYDDPKLGTIIYYHYSDPSFGLADDQKLFGVNQVNFTSGWPVV